ncbi:MAG: hypothetical protein A2236_02280, partial [Bacteroidetes bacterium RIFOXYA2_FULL_33_7]
MKLISFGDKIQEGVYSDIHSVFEKVVNFNFSNDLVVSVVSEEIGNGPFNIVVSNIDFSLIRSIKFFNSIEINGKLFDKSNIQQYDSGIPKINFKHLDKNWEFIAQKLKYSPEKSLAFLLHPEKKMEFSTTFDTQLIKKIETGVENIFNVNNIVSGLKSIKGLGYGLTPSGDDFISGVLTSLNLLEIKNNNSYIELKNKIFETVRGENRISNNSFYISKENLYSEKLKNLLVALSEQNKNEIENAIRNY